MKNRLHRQATPNAVPLLEDVDVRKGIRVPKIRWHAPWFRAGLLRTMSETFLLQLLVTVLWLAYFRPQTAQDFIDNSILLLAGCGPCCVLWAALRLRFPARSRWRTLGLEYLFTWVVLLECLLAMSVAIAGLPATMTILHLPVINITPLYSFYTVFSGKDISAVVLAPVPPIAFLYSALFLILRGSAHALLSWNRLRRTHLRWSLTHAQLMIVVVVLILVSSICGIGVNTSASPAGVPPTAIFPVVLLTLSFTIVTTCIFALPPIALFSYLFIRPTTRRIETLVKATSALRAGNYAMRVDVVGEDEVARLQADFNAMAAELERTMQELQRERDTVSALFQERRELIANVSHDLRTPVATVRSYLESALSNMHEQSPITMHQDMLVMQQQTIRLQALIDDLFTLARVEVDKLEIRCVPTNVVPLVRNTVNTLARIAWKRSKVEMTVEAASFVPCAIVDASRLEQVLQNLLHNAVRHTPPGGIVVVAVDADSKRIRLQIKDTGEGIPSDKLPHIWKRFYRIEDTRMQNEGGTGLGLAIVKELTEAMNGAVSVTSIYGEGTCFTLCFPRAQD